MSEIKVNKVSSRTSNAVTLGTSGDTLTVPCGVTITSAGTVSGNFKDIQWQSVITADGSTNTTAEAGKGYLIDVTSATHTINLPSSATLGDTIIITDVAGQAQSYNITIGRNSHNIEGSASDLTLAANGDSATLTYTGATYGWRRISKIAGPTFVSATGGTETTSGNYKIHTFTSSGCFVVSNTSDCSANDEVSYLVVAGGGGGGGYTGGGGGAGGFREGKSSVDDYTASPIAATSGITVSAQTYPITIGAGGTAGAPTAGRGSNSIFSTITSTGGGGGKGNNVNNPASPGGSGGGGSENLGGSAGPGGSGNTPPVSPSQGNNGGTGSGPGPCNDYREEAGGGGGATAVGGNGTNQGPSTGNGGAGATTSITGSPTAYAGGGGGGKGELAGGTTPSGGSGGGGSGSKAGTEATAGSSNTGGGGGGSGASPSYAYNGKAGGSGIVVIRYKYQ